jgi:hypothetical protein
MTLSLDVCQNSKLHIMPVDWGKGKEYTELWTPSEFLQVRN